MCDPVSAGLMVAGTAFSMYGDTKVAGAQKRDIAKAAVDWNTERTKQQGLTTESQGSVADTLANYSRPATDTQMAGAEAKREGLYTAPIMSHDYVTKGTADTGGNAAVDARNRTTGITQQLKDLSRAKTKAQLDAYGDVNQAQGLYGVNNANTIGMISRIKQGSAAAEAANQGVLPAKLNADQGAGATAKGIGDALKLAAMMTGMSGGFGTSTAGVPTEGTSWLAKQGVPGWLNGGYYAPNLSGPSSAAFSGAPIY